MKTIVGFIFCFVLLVLNAPNQAFAQTISSKVEEQGIAQYIKIEGLVARQRNGLLRIQATLVNTDNEPRQMYWRVKWLDEDGFQVWDDEAWKPLLIHGSSKKVLDSMAPTPKAVDFRIQMNAVDNYSGNSDPNSGALGSR